MTVQAPTKTVIGNHILYTIVKSFVGLSVILRDAVDIIMWPHCLVVMLCYLVLWPLQICGRRLMHDPAYTVVQGYFELEAKGREGGSFDTNNYCTVRGPHMTITSIVKHYFFSY